MLLLCIAYADPCIAYAAALHGLSSFGHFAIYMHCLCRFPVLSGFVFWVLFRPIHPCLTAVWLLPTSMPMRSFLTICQLSTAPLGPQSACMDIEAVFCNSPIWPPHKIYFVFLN